MRTREQFEKEFNNHAEMLRLGQITLSIMTAIHVIMIICLTPPIGIIQQWMHYGMPGIAIVMNSVITLTYTDFARYAKEHAKDSRKNLPELDGMLESMLRYSKVGGGINALLLLLLNIMAIIFSILFAG